MSWGKSRRLQRILPDGKTVTVPMDHGLTVGPINGLANMQRIVDKLLLGGVDAIIVHRGIAKNISVAKAALIVHLSASTSLSSDPNRKICVSSVEEAVRVGADAVSIHINVGAQTEPEMLREAGQIADDCDRLGIPLLAMMYPRGPKIRSEHDPEHVAHAARLGAELGADIVKTNYTGSVETFRSIIESCPVPVVIAGGPKMKTDREVLQMVYDSVRSGGVGVSIGRNVFQNENPTGMVKALAAIVHQGTEVEDAALLLGEKT